MVTDFTFLLQSIAWPLVLVALAWYAWFRKEHVPAL